MGYSPAYLRFSFLDFWSTPNASLLLSSTASSPILNNVEIPVLGSITITGAYAMMRCVGLGATSASNTHLNTNTYLQVDDGSVSYTNALYIPTNTLYIAGSTTKTEYFELIGSIDIIAKVDQDSTINFKWKDAQTNADDMYVHGLQTGIRLIVKGV